MNDRVIRIDLGDEVSTALGKEVAGYLEEHGLVLIDRDVVEAAEAVTTAQAEERDAAIERLRVAMEEGKRRYQERHRKPGPTV